MAEKQQLHIRMLGQFSLQYGDQIICDRDNRSRKAWTLLAYLIVFRDRELPQSELIDLLWADESSDNPSGALKTMFHRLRQMLGQLGYVSGQEMIVLRHGNYGWNNDLDFTLDADDFEQACLAGKNCGDRQQQLEHYRRAVALYQGDFLPRCAMEPWVLSISTYYNLMFLQVVQELIQMLRDEGCLDEVVSLCAHAIEINPYEEFFYSQQIQALVDSGNYQAALAEYEKMKELFFSKFGVTPSDEMKALYREVVHTTNSLQTDLNIIRDQLKETAIRPGAFYCEYEFFKDIYRVEARAASRRGDAIHLGLLTVSDLHGDKLNQRSLNLVMAKLEQLIRSALRRGDVFAKYSVSQYLLMLPHANYEDSQMIVERIVSRFRRENPHSPARISYSVQPLEPIM